MRRSQLHSILLGVAVLWVLWQLWQKVHIVIWVPMPWWVLLLLVLGLIFVLDFVLDRILGKDL